MSKQRSVSVQRGRLVEGGDTMPRDLGWFSVGLGLAALLRPRSTAGIVGMHRSAPLVPLYGLRELATGIGILLADDPLPWVWGRVGGDALDLATLGAGMIGRRHRGRAALAFLAVAGVTALDVLCARTLEHRNRPRRDSHFDYSDRRGLREPVKLAVTRDHTPAQVMGPRKQA